MSYFDKDGYVKLAVKQGKNRELKRMLITKMLLKKFVLTVIVASAMVTAKNYEQKLRG